MCQEKELSLLLSYFLYLDSCKNEDGQSIKDITATLRGVQPQPQPLPMSASSKTRHPCSQNLSSTRPALTRSSAVASSNLSGACHFLSFNLSRCLHQFCFWGMSNTTILLPTILLPTLRKSMEVNGLSKEIYF